MKIQMPDLKIEASSGSDGDPIRQHTIPVAEYFNCARDGVLANRICIAPGGGFNFQVRHLDFHPSRRWVFVSLERQNKLDVFGKLKDGTLSKDPLFSKDTLADPGNVRPGQALGTIHLDP